MCRFASCCTTESHQLYGLFMSKLSACIFQWNSDDVAALRRAKSAKLSGKGVSGLSDGDVLRLLGRKELALHCRRSTRGVEETTRLLQELIACFDNDLGKDSLGVPLLDHDRTQQMWDQQQRHISCIQDPAEVPLYTRTRSLVKVSIDLPTYRCARGFTSLESFHNHMARFIPGNSCYCCCSYVYMHYAHCAELLDIRYYMPLLFTFIHIDANLLSLSLALFILSLRQCTVFRDCGQ